MKKIHREIFKYLGWSEKNFGDIYEYLKDNKVLGSYGLNFWNVNKSVDKLVKMKYLDKTTVRGVVIFKLSIKGIEYLEDMLNEKR